MKLVVEYPAQKFEFDVTDEEYGDFLDDGNVYSAFGATISDVEPEYSATVVI